MSKKKTYAFPEIEQYREHLEIKHLRGKNYIVAGVFFTMMILTLTYMLIARYPFGTIMPLILGYVIILAINFIFSAYGEEDYSYLKVNKYILTLGMFSIVTAMIMLFQSPSLIPLLFVVYCISAIYQDMKVIIISDLYFGVAIVFIVLGFPELLLSENNTIISNFSFMLFAILFLTMLSISAYIIVKEKSFFYNQIAKSKETEFRNIDLLLKLKHETNKEEKNIEEYYKQANEFLQAFTEKLDLPNIFEEKIRILIDLENDVPQEEILENHPDFNQEDIDRLGRLRISNHYDLNRIAVKVSKTKSVVVKRREIFSATHFISFNKQVDSTEIKIIAFVIFYVALKKGITGLDKISDEDIYRILTETDYYYYIDSRVMRIYQENSEVFDEIIADAFSKRGDRS